MPAHLLDPNKVALVTGAAGFVGSHLLQHLRRGGVHVRALVRRTVVESGASLGSAGVDMCEGDVRDPLAVRRAVAGVDTVFHLASRVHAFQESPGELESCFETNVGGTQRLLDAATTAGVRNVVFFSSVKAMGEESDECLDESTACQPVTPYGRSKLAAEQLVCDYGKRTGMHVVCLRLPLVYGPRNRGNILSMISAIDRGWFPPISNVKNRRSMVHVINVVDAAVLAATNPSANGQTYIVTDARPYATGDIYTGICRGLGKPVPGWSVPNSVLKAVAYAGDAIGRIRGRRLQFDSEALVKLSGSAWYSSAKISRELGYRPLTTFEEALPELIAWYKGMQVPPSC